MGKTAILLSAFLSIALIACATADAAHEGHEKQAPAYATGVNWHSLAEGREIARSEKKPMLVDFAVPKGCPRCDFLQNNVYNRDEITARINSDFVPVWIDLSRELTPEEKALGEKYDFRNDCLLLFLDPDGNVLQDQEGKKLCFVDNVPPEVFLDYLDYVLKKYVPR